MSEKLSALQGQLLNAGLVKRAEMETFSSDDDWAELWALEKPVVPHVLPRAIILVGHRETYKIRIFEEIPEL